MSEQGNNQTTIIIQQKSNGVGTAGFVLSLIGLFFFWVPFFGWLIWLLGLILSFVGVFKSPRGLAITGLVISLLDFVLLIVAGVAIMSAF